METGRVDIICTIGPATKDRRILKELIESGMTMARLNFSHGDYEDKLEVINNLKELEEELEIDIPVLLDTKGPEIRLGKLKDGEVNLEKGQEFILSTKEVLGDETIASVSYDGLAKDIRENDQILIDDGSIRITVLKVIEDRDIVCIVENSGNISNNKGINVPNVSIQLPALTQKDKSDIIFGIENAVDYIAASFVRKADDVREIKDILREKQGQEIKIIAKIENQEGLDNLDDIIDIADGIMIARGDLGVEVPLERLAKIQKHIIRKCNEKNKMVITATQMLDSMIRNPRPTRAEVTDIANAIYDGSDGIMLSGETAIGKYPIEAVKMMKKIALVSEEDV